MRRLIISKHVLDSFKLWDIRKGASGINKQPKRKYTGEYTDLEGKTLRKFLRLDISGSVTRNLTSESWSNSELKPPRSAKKCTEIGIKRKH